MLELRNAEKWEQIKNTTTWHCDIATYSLAWPWKTSTVWLHMQVQSQLTTLFLTHKINEQWLTLPQCSSRHSQPSQHGIKHTQWVSLLFLLNFRGNTFTVCGAACSALFIYEGHLILLSDWAKSKQASFQSLLFLFISQCPQQQSGCATFWGMMRKPCPHPLSSLRWTHCNKRAMSWSGKNQLGIKTYTPRQHKWHQ